MSLLLCGFCISQQRAKSCYLFEKQNFPASWDPLPNLLLFLQSSVPYQALNWFLTSIVLKQNKKMIMFALFSYFKNSCDWVLISLILSFFANATLQNSLDPILPPLKTLKMTVVTLPSFLIRGHKKSVSEF